MSGEFFVDVAHYPAELSVFKRLLLPEIQNMFIPAVTFGLEEVLKENGYLALLAYTFYDDDEECKSILTFAQRKIDALVHIGTREYAEKKTNFMTNILGDIPLFFNKGSA